MMVCTHFKKIRRYMWTPFLLHQSQWFSSSSGMPAQQNWTHRRWWEIVKSQSYSLSLVWLFVTPWTVAWEATLSIKFSRQGSGVGCHSFLQGIFLTQELNPGLLYWRQILYHLSHQRFSQNTIWFSKSTAGYISKESKNTNSKKYMQPNVQSCIIHNSQDVEATYVSTKKWMDTEDVLWICAAPLSPGSYSLQ